MKTCLALTISLTLLASQAQAGFVLSSPLHVPDQPRAPSYKEFLAASQPKADAGALNPAEAIGHVDTSVSADVGAPMAITPEPAQNSLSQTLQTWGRADGVTIVNEAGTDLSVSPVTTAGSFTEKVDALLTANPQIGKQMVFKFYQADPKAGTPPVLHVTKGG